MERAVAKIVESSTPDEVFVFGSIYVQSTPEKYLKLASDPEELRSFRTILRFESQRSAAAFRLGRFHL